MVWFQNVRLKRSFTYVFYKNENVIQNIWQRLWTRKQNFTKRGLAFLMASQI